MSQETQRMDQGGHGVGHGHGHGLPSRFLRVDAACNLFESGWRAGKRPRVEQYIENAPEPERATLLRELLALELELRRDQGEFPTTHEYHERFPGFHDQVARAFGNAARAASTSVARASRTALPVTEIPVIPGYEIVSLLGRGGMGIVYRARQLRLDRPCALKMILAGAHAGTEASARFLTEAQTIAKLHHPNVIQIYGTGDVNGQPYLELEYAEGGSLADRFNGGPWKPRDAAKLIEVLARAVGDMHRRGVVHRDLKPANVLMTADGTPKIADFGLAKTLERDSGLTLSEAVIGSPCYMSPEQADGRTRDVGPATDIHALGVILYELLTGRLPFRATSMLETLDLVKSADPVRPSQLVPGLHRDIETICLKSLNKEASRRYATAPGLADDLRRWQAGESILARRAGPTERAWRWCRRQPALAGLIALSTLIALAGFSAAVYSWNESVRLAAMGRAKVESLRTAETSHVPEIVAELAPFRRWTDPLLARMVRDNPAWSKPGLHAALALLPIDAGPREALVGWLNRAETRPDELLVIREALINQGDVDKITRSLWAGLDDQAPLTDAQLRIAGALARFDSNHPRWRGLATRLAAKLVLENPLLIDRWREVFHPIRGALTGPLFAIYFDRRKPEQRALANGVLFAFATSADGPGEPDDLADLITDADAPRFEQLLKALAAHPDRQKWGRASDLSAIDQESASPGPTHGRDWCINRQSQSFSVVRGPVEYLMGTSSGEPGRYADEVRHRVRIARTFAIGMHEVTIAQYRRFLDQSPGVKKIDSIASVKRLCPGPDYPAVCVDWYAAARYCNWLSEQEGIPASQWCYPRDIKEGTCLSAECLNRTGYRLPTEAEWEYSCRAGSLVSRPFGDSEAMIPNFAWSSLGNRGAVNHPVGMLKPNDLGLFDVLGNVWELCHDRYVDPYVGGTGQAANDEGQTECISGDDRRAVRGGSVDCVDALYFRSAMRSHAVPKTRYGSHGFRVARTLTTSLPR